MIIIAYLFTANSFIELAHYRFKVAGAKIFFTRRLCQDPLETTLGVSSKEEAHMMIQQLNNSNKIRKLFVLLIRSAGQ